MREGTVDWTATWIGGRSRGGKRLSAPAPYFRRTFRCPGVVREAVLHITALGLYRCEINGEPVGDHVLAPGWTDYRVRLAFQTHDVAGLLQEGENVIGVVLGDGWYCGHVGNNPREFYGEQPEFLAQLEITMEDGTRCCVTTDAEWTTATGPILAADLLMGTAWDARRDLGAWSRPGYDESAWLPGVAGAAKAIAIEPPLAPPVRRQERIEPVGEHRVGGTRIFDLGQNMVGVVRIRFDGRAGAHVIIRHAEMLNPNGSLYTENLRGARATDEYTCAADGPVDWEPPFTFHGFRYVSVDGLERDAACCVTGVVLHNDMPATGRFRCSHPLLNQLEQNIVWGQKGNFLEVPTDCPQRDERLGWTGDAQVFVRTAAFRMDVRGFFHKWLRDMRDAQGADGAVPCIVPNTFSFGHAGDGGPAWADAAIICPWTLYVAYGEPRFLADHYACMAGYMAYLAAHKVKDGIRGHPEVDPRGGFGDWLALDGSGHVGGGTPKDLIGTAFYAHDADLMARSAAVLGKADDARRYRALHGEIVAAFRRRFVTAEGLLAAGTQTSYVLALAFDLLPDDLRATAARMLVRDIQQRGMHLATGFVGTPYLLDALERHGHLETAYALLEQETFPSWLFPVKNGATTIWERWDGWTPEKGFQDAHMNSFNHYAYGCVGSWMVETVAGLAPGPEAPGYGRILFRPRPGGSLAWAEASLTTVSGGTAAIRWDREGEHLRVAMTVPDGSTGRWTPPPGWEGTPEDLGPGVHERRLHAVKQDGSAGQ